MRPIEVLQQLASYLQLAPFDPRFKVELGRANYTTIERLLSSGAMSAASLQRLREFFAPHNGALHRMFPGEAFW